PPGTDGSCGGFCASRPLVSFFHLKTGARHADSEGERLPDATFRSGRAWAVSSMASDGISRRCKRLEKGNLEGEKREEARSRRCPRRTVGGSEDSSAVQNRGILLRIA
ncbi:unnamed protein product, partial [Urochloa humidicola]